MAKEGFSPFDFWRRLVFMGNHSGVSWTWNEMQLLLHRTVRSRIICSILAHSDAAQRTHPISRADDVDMASDPTIPRHDNRDTASPRRRIGGRCRGWAVSTQIQSQSNKHKCVSSTMRGQQFKPEEPRLQHRANRSMQLADVHAQRITGGIGADHELYRKVATDSEAFETVKRFRDSVLSAAAAVEVVLPIYEQPPDNSTEAPDEND